LLGVQCLQVVTGDLLGGSASLPWAASLSLPARPSRRVDLNRRQASAQGQSLTMAPDWESRTSGWYRDPHPWSSIALSHTDGRVVDQPGRCRSCVRGRPAWPVQPAPTRGTDQHFRWPAWVWSPPPESNRRPHPYHGSAAKRRANPRRRRSRCTVVAAVMGSVAAIASMLALSHPTLGTTRSRSGCDRPGSRGADRGVRGGGRALLATPVRLLQRSWGLRPFSPTTRSIAWTGMTAARTRFRCKRNMRLIRR
jgi:hypothetical protein